MMPVKTILLARWAIFTLVAGPVAGCAVNPPSSPQPAMSQLAPIAPKAQRLTFQHAQNTHRLIGILRHNIDSLKLALVSPQGQRLLTLVADDNAAYFLPEGAFDPPFTAGWLADRLIWSLWPIAALESSFADSEWHLSQAGPVREIRYRKRLIARITQAPRCLTIDDRQGDYRLMISPLDDETNDACSVLP